MQFDIMSFIYTRLHDKHGKREDIIKNLSYYNIMTDTMNLISSIFIYEGAPESLNTKYMEYYLITEGYCGVGIINNELVACLGALNGNLNAYNIPQGFSGVCPTGSLEGVNGKDLIVMKNNEMYTPDLDLYYYADLLNEIMISLRVGTLNTRYNQILLTDDDVIKNELSNMFKGSLIGIPKMIFSKRLSLKDIADNKRENRVEVLDINKLSDSDKLKYLTSLYEDVQRIMLRKYGIHLTNTSKMAQTNKDEVNDGQGLSLITVNDMLDTRRKMINKVNELFNTDITVSLNPVIKENERDFYFDKDREVLSIDQEEIKNEGNPNESDNNGNDPNVV